MKSWACGFCTGVFTSHFFVQVFTDGMFAFCLQSARKGRGQWVGLCCFNPKHEHRVAVYSHPDPFRRHPCRHPCTQSFSAALVEITKSSQRRAEQHHPAFWNALWVDRAVHKDLLRTVESSAEPWWNGCTTETSVFLFNQQCCIIFCHFFFWGTH